MARNANTKNNTDALTLAEKEAQMRAFYKGMGSFTDSEIDAHVAALVERETGAARKAGQVALIEGIDKIASGFDADLFRGATFKFEVAFDKTGNASVSFVKTTKGGGKRGKRGPNPILIHNGVTFNSYAKLCNALGIDVDGDSAVRKYKAALEAGTAPAVVEIDRATWDANEDALKKEHGVK